MKIAATALAALLFSTTAYAADLAPQPVEPIAPVVAPFSWTGFYGGLQAGYTFGKSDYSDYLRSTGLWDYRGSMDPSGFTAGAYVGANYQFANSLVVGAEGDINYDNAHDSARATGNPNWPGGGLEAITHTTQTAKLKWDGSVRLRVGYAIDRFLPYITGGVAFGKFDFSPTWPQDGLQRYSSTVTGWTIGAGLEYAFTDNLIGRVEYRYTDFGDKDYVEPVTPTFNDKIDLKTHVIRAGLAYKF